MDLHEQAFAADGNGSAGERGNEFTLPGGACASPARQLDAVGRIKDDRIAEPPHDGQCAKVRHEVVVAE